MKTLRKKMAELAQVATTENSIGEEKKKKKKGITHGIKKVFKNVTSPHPRPHSPVLPVKEELTAADIQKLIEGKKFWYASEGLVDLEHKIPVGTETEEKEKLEQLHDKLEIEVSQTIKDSLTIRDADLVKQAVQAIVVQEAEDDKCGNDLSTANKTRPKGWKKTWERAVKQSVEERLDKVLLESPMNESSSTLSQTSQLLGKAFKDDLISIATHYKACYPEEYDVCNTYAQHYHRILKSQIESIIQFELCNKDIHFLLCWVHNLYPNLILKHLNSVDESRLESLIPLHRIRQFENDFLPSEAESVGRHMNKALDLEVALWKDGKEPKKLGELYLSELHIDVIQCYDGGLKSAAEIKPELVERLAPLLAEELEKLLRRFKRLLGEFLEKNKTQASYQAICIANLNCCQHFREFVTHTDRKFTASRRQELMSIVKELEDAMYESMLQDLFIDLKSLFRRMSQGGNPFSYQTMKEIMKITGEFVSRFKTLCTPCHKDLILKIHFYLVKEHLTRILKKKVSQKNVQQLQTLANQIKENAALINDFFTFHGSEEEHLMAVLPKIAEIIRLQDLSAVQLEVATMVAAYPDIRNKQIEAILYIKGNLSRSETKSILKIADAVDRDPNKQKTKLFELIKSY
ncbi:tumor necrosis factor alpha-induced protein 2 [Hyperolius riggenbachi]|uniref:tumor necrosis factor alpha-induced protein 2 n=1 Tax=Hyperolius riggenbachi TaxID=752182 RepID=UPI0035A2733B